MADLAVIRAVKASELPKVLTDLVLEYANWTIAQYKEYCRRQLLRVAREITYTWKMPLGQRIINAVINEARPKMLFIDPWMRNVEEEFNGSTIFIELPYTGSSWDAAVSKNLSETASGIPAVIGQPNFKQKIRQAHAEAFARRIQSALKTTTVDVFGECPNLSKRFVD